MKDWKIVIENSGTLTEVNIRAKTYSDAYIKVETLYPDCRVISIQTSKR